jgi:NAD-dependent dihydropyrimidine dehydrogenase PreA subunit
MIMGGNVKSIVFHEEKCTGCLICQFTCSSIYEKKFVPAKAFIQIKNVYNLRPEMAILEDCNQCGQCVQHCLYGALEFVEVVD